jgi:hypothetical protein
MATVAMAEEMKFLSQQLEQVKLDKIIGAGRLRFVLDS